MLAVLRNGGGKSIPEHADVGATHVTDDAHGDRRGINEIRGQHDRALARPQLRCATFGLSPALGIDSRGPDGSPLPSCYHNRPLGGRSERAPGRVNPLCQTPDVSVNVAELVADAREHAPDAVALVEPETGRELTWSELDVAVDRIAGGLSGLGLVAGYRVMIALANRIEFVTTYLGVLRARLVAVPVNPRSATGELVRMMADSGARAVIADSGTVTSVRSAAAGMEDALVGADEELRARAAVPHIVVVGAPTVPGESSYAALHEAPPAAPLPGLQDAEALAVLLYTSGTSGRPRAAMLSLRALLANLEQGAALEPPMIG
jgi:non-ribosomal peptide synthetase component F